MRRATEEISRKQAALRQAEAELVKMRVETLAHNTQIEAIRKAIEELSEKIGSLQTPQLDGRDSLKQLEALSEEIEKMRKR